MQEDKNFVTALGYLSKGYSIIPVGKDKRPLISWQEFQNRIPKKEEVEGWYKKWPDAGIAIVTGKVSGILVFDIDPRNGGSPDPFKKYNTVESLTGGGGNHFIFLYPDFSVPTIPSILQGVDIKSDGGYIVVPPSLHPSGKQYTWNKSILENTPLALPEDLVDLIKGHSQEQHKFDSSILEGVSEGSRNESAASVAGKMLYSLREDDWDTVGWQSLSGWNLKNDPPLPERELYSVFKSICSRERQRRLTNSIPPQTFLENTVAEKKSFDVVSWKSFLDKKLEDEEWLVKGLLRQGWLGVIGGHGKQGKTTLAIHLLNHIRQGKNFFSETKRLPVLYINYEMSEYDTWNLVKTVTNNEGDLSNTYIVNYPPVPLDLVLLEENLSKMEPGVCIIDSFRGAFLLAKDFENQAGEIGQRLRKLQLIARKTNWSIILIHHFKKSGTGEALDLSGSGEWLAVPDVVMTWMCPNMKEAGKLEVIGRIPPLEPLSIKLSREGIEFLGTVADNEMKEQRDKVFCELSEEGKKSSEIAKAIGLPDATVRKRLRELFDDGLSTREGKGVRGNPHIWRKSAFAFAKEIFGEEEGNHE